MGAKNTKESFAKWSPEARNDLSLRKYAVITRHAKEGEKGEVTHSKGEQASGIYLAKVHPKTSEERIDRAALSQCNRAEEVTPVELNRPQNIMVGVAGPQRKFEDDGKSRNGGLRQIVTDGGYKGGAIRDISSPNSCS